LERALPQERRILAADVYGDEAPDLSIFFAS